jgi:hypothetical protein
VSASLIQYPNPRLERFCGVNCATSVETLHDTSHSTSAKFS